MTNNRRHKEGTNLAQTTKDALQIICHRSSSSHSEEFHYIRDRVIQINEAFKGTYDIAVTVIENPKAFLHWSFYVNNAMLEARAIIRFICFADKISAAKGRKRKVLSGIFRNALCSTEVLQSHVNSLITSTI
jgi:hypothetical protein